MADEQSTFKYVQELANGARKPENLEECVVNLAKLCLSMDKKIHDMEIAQSRNASQIRAASGG